METNHIETNEAPTQSNSINWGKRLATGAAAVVVLAGVGAFAASAHDFSGERMRSGMGQNGSMEGHRMEMRADAVHWRGGFGGHGMSRMLDAIDATDEQEDKLEAIFDTVHDEIRPLMRDFRDTRKDLAELLGADTIDRAAVEALRAERLAAIDEATRKVTTALLDAADVLTPEQRKELLDNFEDRRGHRRW